ncbi:GntR family transcriptional regulator [Jatrophihabitans fulvus]
MSPRRREAPPGPTGTARLTDQLRQEILLGRLPSDHPLREEELATAHDVSRHTVRAALARLADERLVIAEPYRGMRVTGFTDADVLALQQLRGALESEAVRLLRAAHGEAWPSWVTDPVRAAIAGLGEQAGGVDDWPAVAAAHAEIHTALVAASGSVRISEAYRRLHSEMLLLLVQVRPDYTVAGLVTEHERYLDDVQRRGTPAVREHLDHSTELIVRARGSMPRGPTP